MLALSVQLGKAFFSRQHLFQNQQTRFSFLKELHPVLRINLLWNVGPWDRKT